MKRTFQWVTMFTVAAGMTAMAQQTTPATSDSSAMHATQGQKVTVQGCLQAGAGMGNSSSTSSQGTGTSSYGTPSPTGSTGSAGSTATGAVTPGSTTPAGSQASAKGSGMYMLRVTDASGNAATGMPSATGGQADARAAAGQQGAKMYHLMADASNDLSKHVGHQIEVTGTVSSAGQHSGMRGMGATGTTGSGSTGSGAATPTDSTTGSTAGSAAGAGSMAAMAGKAAATEMLHVTSLKMIAATCR